MSPALARGRFPVLRVVGVVRCLPRSPTFPVFPIAPSVPVLAGAWPTYETARSRPPPRDLEFAAGTPDRSPPHLPPTRPRTRLSSLRLVPPAHLPRNVSTPPYTLDTCLRQGPPDAAPISLHCRPPAPSRHPTLSYFVTEPLLVAAESPTTIRSRPPMPRSHLLPASPSSDAPNPHSAPARIHVPRIPASDSRLHSRVPLNRAVQPSVRLSRSDIQERRGALITGGW